jgi:hypothetical protein
MVTDRLGWSVRAADWLAEAVARASPSWHLLWAPALARACGEVGYNPRDEIGSVEVALEPGAGRSCWAGCRPLPGARLPRPDGAAPAPGARRLASSDRDATQAFTVFGCAWESSFT